MSTQRTSSEWNRDIPFSCIRLSLIRYSNLREIVLIPNRHWGGEGLLGCGVGYVLNEIRSSDQSEHRCPSSHSYGLLHRIPIPTDSMQASHSYLPSNVTTNINSRKGITSASRSPVSSPVKLDKGKAKGEGSESGYVVSS